MRARFYIRPLAARGLPDGWAQAKLRSTQSNSQMRTKLANQAKPTTKPWMATLSIGRVTRTSRTLVTRHRGADRSARPLADYIPACFGHAARTQRQKKEGRATATIADAQPPTPAISARMRIPAILHHVAGTGHVARVQSRASFTDAPASRTVCTNACDSPGHGKRNVRAPGIRVGRAGANYQLSSGRAARAPSQFGAIPGHDMR